MTAQWMEKATGAKGRELARGDSDGGEYDHPDANEHDPYAERRHAIVRFDVSLDGMRGPLVQVTRN
jgi:hypothetical protein